KKLESRQQELRKTVSRTEHDGRTVDDDSAQDVADRAASSYTKEFLFHQSNTERQTLQMVDNALARIREGTFGECVSCGNELNSKIMLGAIIALIIVAGVLGGWYYLNTQDEKASVELTRAVRAMESPIRPAGAPAQPDLQSYTSAKERSTDAHQQFQVVVDK